MTIVDGKIKADSSDSAAHAQALAAAAEARRARIGAALRRTVGDSQATSPPQAAKMTKDTSESSQPYDETKQDPPVSRRTMKDVISEANDRPTGDRKSSKKAPNGRTREGSAKDPPSDSNKEPDIISEGSKEGSKKGTKTDGGKVSFAKSGAPPDSSGAEKVDAGQENENNQQRGTDSASSRAVRASQARKKDDENAESISKPPIGNGQGQLHEPKFVIEEEDDSLPEMELQQDVYGMFFIEGFRSLSFFYALACYAMQIAICCLIVVDLLDHEDVRPGSRFQNFFKIPVDVDIEVGVAQFLSLIIVFATSEDFMSSINMIKCGYPRGITEKFRGATRASFHLSNFLRCSEGILLISTTFLLVVQTDEVLEIFLNFAAIEFVANLDDVAFHLAHQGFLNQRLEKAANKVESVKLRQTRLHLKWLVNTIFAFMFLALLAAFLTVVVRQASGFFFSQVTCKKLDVQLGDSVYELPGDIKLNIQPNPENPLEQFIEGSSRNVPFLEIGEPAPTLQYAYFSTDYHAETQEGYFGSTSLLRVNGRPVYWENGIKDATSGKFYYCENAKAWVFTIEVFFNTPGAMPDQAKQECPEGGWLMQSPVTSETGLDGVDTEGWVAWTGQIVEAEGLSFACMECSRDADCGLIYGDCTENRTCSCMEGWQGDFCDVEDPYCPALMWIEYGDSSSDYSVYGYYRLMNEELYGRPVYSDFNEQSEAILIDLFSNATTDDEVIAILYDPEYDFAAVGLQEVYELVLYTGRRWFDLYFTMQDFLRLMQTDREPHPYWDDLFEKSTRWFSETTKNQMPIGLTWYNIRDSQARGSYGPFGATYEDKVAFECMDTKCIDNQKICGNFGTCMTVTGNEDKFDFHPVYSKFSASTLSNTSSACLCREYYGGVFCEFSPFEPYAVDQYTRFLNDDADVLAESYPSLYWQSTDYVVDSTNATLSLNVTGP